MCTDHSPVYLDLSLSNIHMQRGSGFWKYNSSLNKDPIYKENLRALLRDFLQANQNLNGQLKWELLKWEVKKFTISYTSKIAKEKRANKALLEKQIAVFNAANVDENNVDFKKARDDLEQIFCDQAAGIRIRSKCDWYELGEKSNKYFLNLEKRNAVTSTITKLTDDNKIVTNQVEVLHDIEQFYTNLFTNRNKKTAASCKNFIQSLNTPILDEVDQLLLSLEIAEGELYAALFEMQDGKSPGNDGLSAEFYIEFGTK